MSQSTGSILPRVTFGIIVLNGEPFTQYTIRALYPYAHEIIVAEGAAPAARGIATHDGHSRDGTLDILRRFKEDEDPLGKVSIVTAEDEGHPNGFWPGEKDEQSEAYARRATGDYLWQVDIDEFYREEDIEYVLGLLREDDEITVLSFQQVTFWGGLDCWVDGWYLRRHANEIFRVFKWAPDHHYVSHRPPTVVDASGHNLKDQKWLRGEDLAKRGARMLHYSLLFPKQVKDKSDYYSSAPWVDRQAAVDWATRDYMALERPYRVHNVYDYPSWFERYRDSHPEQVLRMVADLLREDPASFRDMSDVDRLLASRRYRIGRTALKVLDPVDRFWRRAQHLLRRVTRRAWRVIART